MIKVAKIKEKIAISLKAMCVSIDWKKCFEANSQDDIVVGQDEAI